MERRKHQEVEVRTRERQVEARVVEHQPLVEVTLPDGRTIMLGELYPDPDEETE